MSSSTRFVWLVLGLLLMAVVQQGQSSIIKNSKYCNPDNQVKVQAEKERSLPIDQIECGEVVAYLEALHRYYGRRCSRLGANCWDKDAYPAKWFDQVVGMMTAVCQKMNAEAAAKEAERNRSLGDPCGARNRV